MEDFDGKIEEHQSMEASMDNQTILHLLKMVLYFPSTTGGIGGCFFFRWTLSADPKFWSEKSDACHQVVAP
jgi:hypothetical protein